jgi:MFS family permease
MRKTLFLIVLAQFLCTSLWFAGNAVLPDLIGTLGLEDSALGFITGAVQLGFIVGTLAFAIFTIPDRFSPSKVFFLSALVASFFNLAILLPQVTFSQILLFRFMTGFFLAGIYPVGMKIAADYFDQGLGASLGFLVGALVLGTAFPHLIRTFSTGLAWEQVIYATSIVAVLGGLMIAVWVPDGPYRKQGMGFQWKAFFSVFQDSKLRNPAMGYFGHMWELYAFWAFVPFLVSFQRPVAPEMGFTTSLLSFLIIGIGSIACFISGMLSQKWGAARIATGALTLSMMCCFISPVALLYFPFAMRILFLMFWGMVVIADSPMFSTLVAKNAPATSKGTALTMVNCIGFSLTIVSILFLQWLLDQIPPYLVFMFLGIGPVIGLFFITRKERNAD